MKKLFTTLMMLIAALMLGTSCEQLGIEDPNDNKTEQEGNGSNDDQENNGENQKPGEDEGESDNTNTPGEGEGEGDNTNTPGEGEGEGEGDNTNTPSEGEGEGDNTNTPGEGEGDNTPGEGEGDGNDDTVSNLTPGQHKQRLEEIGMNFLKYFDAEEHQELADAIIALSEYLVLAEEIEPIEPDYNYNNPNESVTFSIESNDGTRAMMTAMLGIAQGSPAAMVEFATRAASEDFIIDANEYGGMSFSYDTELEEWVEGSDAKDNEIKASWPGGYAANVTWSNSSKTWEYTVEDVRYRVYVPSEINFAVTADGKKLVTIAVQPKLTDNFSIAPDVTVTIPGGFVTTVKSTADPKQVNASVVLSKDGKKLLAAGATVAINDFTDPDNWYYEDSYTWSDGYNDYVEEYDYYDPTIYLLENAKNGQFQVDILELTMVGMGDFRTIYDKSESFDDDWESERWADAMVKVINEQAEVKLFYNDTKEKVCNVVAQKTKYTDEYGEWNGSEYVAKDYYSFEPIMLFPDDSKYSFESYFSGKKFQNLIEAFEKLVEDYEALLGDNF